MDNLTESNQRLFLLLEQCRDTSTIGEDAGASSTDTGGPYSHPTDDVGAYGAIPDDSTITADSKLADYRDEIHHLRAELSRLRSAMSNQVKSVLAGSAEWTKYWVDEATTARAQSDRLSSQLAASVPIKLVLDGSAECVKLWVDKAEASRAELNGLSAQLAASVPIASVLDGSAECAKPWVDKLDAARTELDHLSSQLAVSVPIRSVLDGSAECMKKWHEKIGAVILQLTNRVKDQSAKVQDLEVENSRLQSNLDSTEKQLKYADEEVRRLQARLEAEEQKDPRHTEALRERAQSNEDICLTELQLRLIQAKPVKAKIIDRLNVNNNSLQQSNGNILINCNRLKQSSLSADDSDQNQIVALSNETQDGLSNSSATTKGGFSQEVGSLKQENATLQQNCDKAIQSRAGTHGPLPPARLATSTHEVDQRPPAPPPPAKSNKKGWIPARYTQTELSLMSLAAFAKSPNSQPAESIAHASEYQLYESLVQVQQELEGVRKKNKMLLARNRALCRGNARESHEATTDPMPAATALPMERMQLLDKEKSLREADKQITDLKLEVGQHIGQITALDQSIAEMKTTFLEIRESVGRIEDQANQVIFPGANDIKALSCRSRQRLAALRAAIGELHLRFSYIESRQNSNGAALKTGPFLSLAELESLRQWNGALQFQVNDLCDELDDCSAIRFVLKARVEELQSYVTTVGLKVPRGLLEPVGPNSTGPSRSPGNTSGNATGSDNKPAGDQRGFFRWFRRE